MLQLYRRILAARRGSPALVVGEITMLDTADGVIGYERRAGDDRRVVLVNFTDAGLEVPTIAPMTVVVASDGAGEGDAYAGVVPSSAALILR